MLSLVRLLAFQPPSSLPGSSVHGIFQARVLEWVAIAFSVYLLRLLFDDGKLLVAQSCLTLSDPMDYSPPGSSIHGILQARVLEWGAIAFSNQISLASKVKFPGGFLCQIP